jgi:hypothetical protein
MHHREHPSKAADRIGGKAGAAKSGQSAPLIGARDSIEPLGGAGCQLQRVLKQAIAPQQQPGSV